MIILFLGWIIVEVFDCDICNEFEFWTRLRSKEPFLKVLVLHKLMISKQRKFLLVGFQLQSVKV